MEKKRMSLIDETPGLEPNEMPANPNGGFLTVLWQRKALVLLGLVLGLVGGAIYYWQSPLVYQTTTQMWVIKKNASLPMSSGVDPRMTYVEDYMATHLYVLRSPVVFDRAFKKKNLESLKTFKNCRPGRVHQQSLFRGTRYQGRLELRKYSRVVVPWAGCRRMRTSSNSYRQEFPGISR